MNALPPSLLTLVEQLSRLPGLGKKSALRHALHLVKEREHIIPPLLNSLNQIRESLQFCSQCYSISEESLCSICSNPLRDEQIICVVEGFPELLALEEGQHFTGKYHVLHGLLSPLRGIGPGHLRLPELHKRCMDRQARELIIATSLTSEGETTALYLKKLFADSTVRLSRLASGIPFGGNIEFMDSKTLAKALGNRHGI